MNRKTINSDVIAFQNRWSFRKFRSNVSKYFLKLQTDPKYYFQNQSYSLLKKNADLYSKLSSKPDIIIAHWISNFVTIENLYQLSLCGSVPVVWYLMDMAPLTGGCHYAWDCNGYMNQCGNCPALHSNQPFDLSYKNLQKKRDLIQKMNLTVVSASSWLTRQAKKATVFNGKRIEQIMLGVDAEIFKPISRDVARKKLKLPPEPKIVFFGAQSKEERKGMLYLIEALKSLKKHLGDETKGILIITAGNISEIEPFLIKNFQHRHLGFLAGDRMLATAYQAADVFICPSIEDSGPMMINESIMCGTPVVSFEMGVSLDLVQTGKTGYRAKLKNSEDLGKGIIFVLGLNSNEAGNMFKQCQAIGAQFCNHQVQAGAFKRLFESILGDSVN
ncbi:MAG: glycosyltransferase [Sedimentisphaerales bacterium]|nr:glycosyltransferase [Sedimentisphaerales bacterium]